MTAIDPPISTAEIRWFSPLQKPLKAIFKGIVMNAGTMKENRIDRYLKTRLTHTGVKIREGNHEIKVKSGESELFAFGVIEYWMKWSHSTSVSIEQKIGDALLFEWLPIRKARTQLYYKVENNLPEPIQENIFVPEGFGLEFTCLSSPLMKKDYYTLGLEAFSKKDLQRSHLACALELIRKHENVLYNVESYGYPEWLYRVFSD